MKDEKAKPETSAVGEMRKRRETMADKRRYIIYYTFGADEKPGAETENREAK